MITFKLFAHALCFVQARYTMGTSSVSRLQYSERDLTTALVRVAISPSPEDDHDSRSAPPVFIAMTSTDDNDSAEKENEPPSPTLTPKEKLSGLRRRNVGKEDNNSIPNSSPKNDEVPSLINSVEELTVDSKTSKEFLMKKKGSSNDPLRWFGVLTPRVLKQSQSSFREATEIVCELASLQARLLDIRGRYRTLLAVKHRISSPEKEENSTPGAKLG